MRQKIKTLRKLFVRKGICFFTSICLICSFMPIGLSFQPETAYATNALNVYVGYAGGPYYLKASYTEDELEAMADDEVYTYTGVDKGNYLNLFSAWGIPLDKFFSYTADKDETGYNQGVNTSSLWRIFFATEEDDRYNKLGYDGYGLQAWYWSKYSNYDSAHTLDVTKTKRYYYSNFAYYYDYSNKTIAYDENGSKESTISESGSIVPSMIALKYHKQRIYSLSDWKDALENYSSLESLGDTDNRLIYGQTSPSDVGVGQTVYGVRSVYCVYSGRPTVSLNTEQITGRIGETVTVRASITSADPLISQEGVKDIKWESEDESVARVTSNNDGTANVTIVGNGDVKIKATFGDSSYGEFVTSAEANVSGPGGSGWRGDGEGAGWTYGDGDGEQGLGTGSTDGSGNNDGDGELGSADDGTQGDANENTNIGEDGSNANPDKSVFGINSDTLTKIPDNAVQMVLSNSNVQQAASSSASEAGAGGSSSSNEVTEENATGEEDPEVEEMLEEITEQEWTTAYKINLDELEDELTTIANDSLGIPWTSLLVILACFLVGCLGEFVFFRKSLDKPPGTGAFTGFVRRRTHAAS